MVKKAVNTERTQLVRTTKNCVGYILFHTQWRSVSGTTPVLFWIRSVLGMEKNFSVTALLYGLPLLDIDGVIP